MRTMSLLCACMALLSLGAFAQKTEPYIRGHHFGMPMPLEGSFAAAAAIAIAPPTPSWKASWFRTSTAIPVSVPGNASASVALPSATWVAPPTLRAWALGGRLDTRMFRKIALRLNANAVRSPLISFGELHLRSGVGLVYHF